MGHELQCLFTRLLAPTCCLFTPRRGTGSREVGHVKCTKLPSEFPYDPQGLSGHSARAERSLERS